MINDKVMATGAIVPEEVRAVLGSQAPVLVTEIYFLNGGRHAVIAARGPYGALVDAQKVTYETLQPVIVAGGLALEDPEAREPRQHGQEGSEPS